MGCRGRPLFDLNELSTGEEDEKDSVVLLQPQKSIPISNPCTSGLFPASEGCQRIVNNHAFTHASSGSGFQPFVRNKDPQNSKESYKHNPDADCSNANQASTSMSTSHSEDDKVSALVSSSNQDPQAAEREEGEWSDIEGNVYAVESNASNKHDDVNSEISQMQRATEESKPVPMKADENSCSDSSLLGPNNNEVGDASKDAKVQGPSGSENNRTSHCNSKGDVLADGLVESSSIAKPKEVKGVEASYALRFANNPAKRPKLDEHKEAMLGKKRARQTVFINVEDAKQAGPMKSSTPRRQTSFPTPIITRSVKDTTRASPGGVERAAERQSQPMSRDQKQADMASSEGSNPVESSYQKADSNGDANPGSISCSKKMNNNEFSSEACLPPIPRQVSWKQPVDSRQYKNPPISCRKPSVTGQSTSDQKLGSKKHLPSKKQTSNNLQYQDTSVERLLREVTNEKFWHHPGVTCSCDERDTELGSGLGVSSSSHASLPNSSRLNLPSSSGVEDRPERRPYYPEWLVFEDDSALHNSKVAREVVRCALLPADRAELEAGGVSDFVDQVYCSAVRHLHEIDMLASAAASYQNQAWKSQKGQEVVEKKLAEAEARWKESTARAEVAESELKLKAEHLEEEEASHALTRSALRASEARLADAQSVLVGQKYEAGILRLKIEQLEAREKKAMEQARNAVQIFRESAEYREELEEETVDGFIRGFENFRAQVLRLCPKLDFSNIRPRLLGAAEDDSAPESPEAETELAVVEAETGMALKVAHEIPSGEAS
ncbi:uncharacterized protein LOC103707104 [Phoenix dactylifera]|uniref:Uncharacterized protein LOC103707104 n=1 Tax=Phoenix dactylifera TaxID=42345 RepID=A0A8B9AI73_PHODC|nr:uncharacterized protein LOC103707104 [Phoenix dactylifera]XP_038985488.1 uncharacterized protein LOC103707104 [Phoenix dactylifera]XP_038985489.1 uncharacterized protein LOC103707104 [Phoenix dactylifera]